MKTLQARTDFDELKDQFKTEGYAVARGLFSPEEVEDLKQTLQGIHARGPVPELFDPVSHTQAGGDPLKEYPRVLQPHRFNDTARHYMLHPGVRTCLNAILGEEPVATQSIFYFKPPGAKGIALHQDNYYLLVSPGTCIGAWTALDDADLENGCMYVVPGSHKHEIFCPEKADPTVSQFADYVPAPRGLKAVSCPVKAGDTLFFNGSLIHGSSPNRSRTRFRRVFVCHYAAGSLRKISKLYFPLVRMDGSLMEVETNQGGGPCGKEWAGETHG